MITFDEVYAQTRDKVRKVAKRYSRPSSGDADDLEQEIWLRIMRDLPLYDGSMDIGAFVWVRARSVALDRPVKRRRAQRDASVSFEGDVHVGEVVDGEAAAFATARLRDARRVAHQTFTPQQLAVFRLLEQEASGRDISRALDVSPATVVGHTNRMRKKLIDKGV